MTTAAPPCAPVTAVTRSTTGGENASAGRPLAARPAYPVLNTGVWRGGLRPPSEPPVSRAAAGAPDARGRRPRTPAAAPAWRSGAPLWSPPTSRRQTSSPPQRRPSGSPTSGSGPTRSRPASVTGASMLLSASRTTRRPVTSSAAASTRPRAGCWPSRRDESRRRRGLGATPNPGTKSWRKSGLRGCRSYDRRGVAPSPALRPKGGERIRQYAAETQQGQRVSGTVTAGTGANNPATKGGASFLRRKVTPLPTPATAKNSRRSGAPLSGRTTGSGRRERPARPPRGGGGPDGGAPGRRSQVRYVPDAAPPRAARGPGFRRPACSKPTEVPAATPFDPGFPARRGCVAGCDARFYGSLVSRRHNAMLCFDARGAERRACRLKPAFQAGCAMRRGSPAPLRACGPRAR